MWRSALTLVSLGSWLGCTRIEVPHHYHPVPVHRFEVRPSETAVGEGLSDEVAGKERLHVVTVPDDVPRSGELFVFLPGTGASTQQFDWIANFAAFHGTPTITLAYENDISSAARCEEGTLPGCRGDDPYCDEAVRLEALYGRGRYDSQCIDVPDEESIVHRTLRLMQWLVKIFPDEGLERHLSADGEELAWDTLGFGGWSQGGGHAGLLARDHRLARAIYLSKGAGAVACSLLEPELQAVWGCDPTLNARTARTSEERAAMLVPSPWVFDRRATPANVQHGAVHLREVASLYSFETFEAFHMIEDPSEAIDVDAFEGPLEAGGELARAAVVVTDATPSCGSTSFHTSMATDRCLALGPDGVPVLADAYSWFFADP